jgi:hypothetical protein
MIAYVENRSLPRSTKTPTRSPTPPRSSQPEIHIVVDGLTEVESGETLLRFTGAGTIEPFENGTEIQLREAIVDGAQIIADGLAIRVRIELFGPAVLSPVAGGHIAFGQGIQVALTATAAGIPRLVIGFVGDYSVVPDTVEIDVGAVSSIPSQGQPVIEAETLNCDAWLAKTVLSGGNRFQVVCEANGSISALALRQIGAKTRSEVPVATRPLATGSPAPAGDDKIFLGLTKKQLIIAGAALLVLILLIGCLARVCGCGKGQRRVDRSDNELGILEAGQGRPEDIYT